jgi:hypothetical protein
MWKKVEASLEMGDLKVIGNKVREKHGLPPIDSE